jgi:hypothetical protein
MQQIQKMNLCKFSTHMHEQLILAIEVHVAEFAAWLHLVAVGGLLLLVSKAVRQQAGRQAGRV